MKSDEVSVAFRRAITALGSTPRGEIQRLTVPDGALALSALPNIASLARVRGYLAERLQAQLSPAWIREGDLYDVFAVLAALWRYNPELITGEYLAYATRRLIGSEVAVGGPYYSIAAVDVGANAQIAMFMRLAAKPLPGVDIFLCDAVITQRFKHASPTPAGVVYLLGKACDTMGELTRFMLHRYRQLPWQTPQGRAITLSILGDALPSSTVQQMLKALCDKQRPSGFWEGEPFMRNTPKHRFTTTAIIVETLARYQTDRVLASRLDLEQKHQAVLRAVQQIFGRYSEPLRSSALTLLDQMCGNYNNTETTLLPFLFGQALKASSPLTDQQYVTLGSASVCGWIAYTIYDDFLDEEGIPARLPLANSAMRASLERFRAALPDKGEFHQYVADVFEAMDGANLWELTHCRFKLQDEKVVVSQLPRYGNGAPLATRSFAHALGPMAITQQLPHSRAAMRHIEVAFRHYLMARQLSDDMHDWPKDMKAGHASYVVTAILRDMRVNPGMYDLPILLPAMQKCFRKTTMPRVCRRLLVHITTARRNLEKSQLLRPVNDIYMLLDTLELSTRQALDVHAKSHAFSKVRIK